MKVFVLTEEPYHENSTVLGVFATLEGAIASRPDVKFAKEGYYVDNHRDYRAFDNCVAQGRPIDTKSDTDFLIFEHEVKA